jgi:branched-chain amino acid transport system permease protein
VFVLVVAMLMFVALYLLLKRTRAGLIIQASLSRPDIVAALGHNVPLVFMGVFAFGTGLAALGGVVGGIYMVTDPGMAFMMGPIVFVVVVLGGLGSILGALIASLVIGILQTFALSVDLSLAQVFSGLVTVPPDSDFATLWYMDSARLAPVLPFLLLVLTLVFRPRGLMGTRET